MPNRKKDGDDARVVEGQPEGKAGPESMHDEAAPEHKDATEAPKERDTTKLVKKGSRAEAEAEPEKRYEYQVWGVEQGGVERQMIFCFYTSSVADQAKRNLERQGATELEVKKVEASNG